MEANLEQNNDTHHEEAPQDIAPIEQQFADTHEESPVDSFDDLIGTLDPKGDISGGFEDNKIEQAIVKPVAPQAPPPQPIESAPTNDEVRYQYWQSEAAKKDNQIQEMQNTISNLSKQPAAPAPTEAKAPGKEEFPPPPVKPERPIGYNREEAYADPNSTSAQYDTHVEQWREDMVTYGNLQNQYQIATMQEVYNKKIDGLQKIELQRQAYMREQQETSKVRQYVASNYDLGDNLDNFISEMSDPKSINMNDLVGYYKYKKGIAGATPNANAQPSPQFNQVKRSQSVPSPMGVQSGQSRVQTSPDDTFMDSLIKGEEKNNIF